jgi:membrane protein DedA with SNARE-associated domain
LDSILHLLATYGYLGIFFLLLLGIVGLPLPDETVLLFAGYLIFKGYLQPLPAAAAAWLGACCGITVSYSLGRYLGFFLLRKYGGFLHISPARLSQVQAWFQRLGKWALFFGYFIVGVRHLTAFAAGSSRLRFRVFAPFAYAGGFLWALSFLSLGYFLGEELPKVYHELRHGVLIASGLVILLVSAFLGFRYFQNRRLAS